MDITTKIDLILINEIDLTGSKKDQKRRIIKVIRYVLENPHRIPATNWEEAFLYMAKKENLSKKDIKKLLKTVKKQNINYPFELARQHKGAPKVSKLILPVDLTTFYLGK